MNMKKFKVLIPFGGEVIGNIISSKEHEISESYGDIFYNRLPRSGKIIWSERILPHEIAIMVKIGILEEVN